MNMEQTRREFLRTAGKITLSAAAVSAVPALVKAEATEIAAPAWPWEYKPVDKAAVQARVWANFNGKNGGCCAGVASGILEVMAETYGYPYNQINGHMFANGGGGYGKKTLCGALGGALAILGLFLESSDSGKLRNELYAWYTSTALPIYQPADKPAHPVTTVAPSQQCSDSVGTWCTAAGLEFGTPERGVRCGSLSADVAAKTIELLNAHFGFGAAAAEEEAAPELAANEYIGVGKSEIGGDVKVKVTMDGDNIAKIEVLEHNETPGYFEKSYPSITDALKAANGKADGIDTKTGATKTADALIAAVQDALSKVKK